MSAATGRELHYRVCTLCEAMCGLEITHVGGDVLGIRGGSRSPACPTDTPDIWLYADTFCTRITR